MQKILGRRTGPAGVGVGVGQLPLSPTPSRFYHIEALAVLQHFLYFPQRSSPHPLIYAALYKAVEDPGGGGSRGFKPPFRGFFFLACQYMKPFKEFLDPPL